VATDAELYRAPEDQLGGHRAHAIRINGHKWLDELRSIYESLSMIVANLPVRIASETQKHRGVTMLDPVAEAEACGPVIAMEQRKGAGVKPVATPVV
jgi:hypothetical protein